MTTMAGNSTYRIRIAAVFAACALFCASNLVASSTVDPRQIERSFQLQVSLSTLPSVNQWNTNFPGLSSPSESEIRHAARLLTDDYAANRLYLVYQKEISLGDAERVFSLWRQFCPAEVELVPTLVLNSGPRHEPVFSAGELKVLAAFFSKEVNATTIAIVGAKQSDP